MHSFDRLYNILNDRIEALAMPEMPELLYGPIRYTMEDGGKRIRPVGLLMACELFGGDIGRALPAALAVEVFHNFTLLHDDIMDKAPIRRGRPAVYKKWGENAAILSGDVMMIMSYRLLADSPPEKLGPVLDTFNKISTGVCEGQSYDMEYEAREEVSVGEYLEMIGLKTAILIGGAFKMGALLGGASATAADILYRFGYDLGMAFQIQDDILDTYADETTLGKAIGGDILVGKKTFLLTNALSLADNHAKTELKELLGDGSISGQEKIERVKNIYDRLFVRELAEQSVNRYFEMAAGMLTTLDAAPEKLGGLYEYADILLNRKK